jgi:hypothetical protein
LLGDKHIARQAAVTGQAFASVTTRNNWLTFSLCSTVRCTRLRDLGFFDQVRLDVETRTLVRSNGAGFDPYGLHEMKRSLSGTPWVVLSC